MPGSRPCGGAGGWAQGAAIAIGAPDPARQRAAYRMAINTVVQGTAADIMKWAMLAVETWLREEGGVFVVDLSIAPTTYDMRQEPQQHV